MNKSSDHNIKAAHVSWQLNELIKIAREKETLARRMILLFKRRMSRTQSSGFFYHYVEMYGYGL